MRTLIAIGTASLLLIQVGILGGCSGGGERAEPTAREMLGDPPSYAAVREVYNNRVDGLARLWARAVVSVSGSDAEGSPFREQGEGHLQVVRPERVSLTAGKLGKPMFIYGSNAEQSWWIDRSGSPSVAVIGPHAGLTRDDFVALGLPVHPLELVELLGISPLPEADRPLVWSRDGTMAGFLTEGVLGYRLTWIDPQTFDPVRIALLDERGEPLVASMLTGMQGVRIEGDATRRPRVPDRVVVEVAGTDLSVRVSLNDPRNRRIDGRNFEGETLLEVYKVDQVERIGGASADAAR